MPQHFLRKIPQTYSALHLRITHSFRFFLYWCYVHFYFVKHCSVKAIESTDKSDDTKWLTYWVVYAVFSLMEFFTDIFFWWIPLYAFLKVSFPKKIFWEPHLHVKLAWPKYQLFSFAVHLSCLLHGTYFVERVRSDLPPHHPTLRSSSPEEGGCLLGSCKGDRCRCSERR